MLRFKNYFYIIISSFALSPLVLASFQEEQKKDSSFTNITSKDVFDTIEELRKISPEEGRDLNKLNYELKCKIEELLKRHNGDCDEVFLKSQPAFQGVIQSYIEYMQPFEKNNKAVTQIIQSLKDDQKQGKYIWLNICRGFLNFATAISETPPEDEKDFFNHTIVAALYKTFVDNCRTEKPLDLMDIFQNFLKAKKNIEVKAAISAPYDNHVSDVGTLLTDNTAILRAGGIIPALGVGKIDILSLNFSILNDIHVVALPTDRSDCSAHALENMSSLGFLMHDVAHNDLDQDSKLEALDRHCIKAVNTALKNGIAAPKFMKEYGPLALKRYHGILSLFQLIMHEMMKETLKDNNIIAFRESMVGLFYLLHESLGWTEEMYEEDSAIKIIQMVSKKSSENLPADSFLLAADPFKTSPVDGQSSFTDDEIIQYYIENFSKNRGAENRGAESSISERGNLTKENIYQRNVKRTNFFIDTEIILKNNKKFFFSEPTLFFKFRNIKDAMGLLKYGGDKTAASLEATILPEAPHEARMVAMNTLEQVKQLLQDKINVFSKKAQQILLAKPDDGASGIEEKFSLWSQALKSETEKLMTPVAQPSS